MPAAGGYPDRVSPYCSKSTIGNDILLAAPGIIHKKPIQRSPRESILPCVISTQLAAPEKVVPDPILQEETIPSEAKAWLWKADRGMLIPGTALWPDPLLVDGFAPHSPRLDAHSVPFALLPWIWGKDLETRPLAAEWPRMAPWWLIF